jgi:CheY-like chemotaxis protein
MAMAGFYEVRHVRSETTAKACSRVPAPAGRLYGTGGRCSQQQCAVAFRFHGNVLGQPGGVGAELECRPENHRSRNTDPTTGRSPHVVLIVEHDELLKSLTADIMQDAGFVVLQASDADKAVTILEARSDIALLLTSITMPSHMDGLSLAHMVATRWPAVKIVIASSQIRLAGTRLPKNSSFFLKLYDSQIMISQIRSLLGP